MTTRAARLAALVALVAARVGAGEPERLEFHRVHVPADRIDDVPLGSERLVPVPLADFEAAVARARAAAAGEVAEPGPAVTTARWRAAIDDSGALVGTVSCAIGAEAAGTGRLLQLGGLGVRRGRLEGDPPREVTVCGGGAGLAVAIGEPGTYVLEFIQVPEAGDAASYRLPLLTALSTSIAIDLPPGTRPVLAGPAARRALVAPPAAGGGAWRIDCGPAPELVVSVVSGEPPAPALGVWSDVAVSASRAELSATVLPVGPWRAGRLDLEQDAALRVTDVRVADEREPLAHAASADGRTLSVTLPRWLEGGRRPIVVRGVAPATGVGWRVPLLRAPANAWAGGGTSLRVAAEFEVRELDLAECQVVPPETAATWPRDAGVGPAEPIENHPGAVMHLEQQGPEAAAMVELGPKTATFDVARVTTVDIAPGAVLGRAACDVRVTGGEAFEIVGRVAPGWIIDAVDSVDGWPGAAAAGEQVAPAAGNALDWRVVPSPAGDSLRIDLAFGATRRGGVGLRIAGHRPGLAPGAAFTIADVDMVRFDGESADAAVLDLNTGPDAFVELSGRPAGWFELEGRLAALAEGGLARGRVRAGDRAPDLEARLVRRRPPLDVDVLVRLEPRDDRLVQAFTFDCRAAAGVESLVVAFADPGGAGLAWRVESPADVGVTAQPLGAGDGGPASRSPAVKDSWLVALSPPATGPVRIRATRSVPFAAAVPVPLAWVEGAEETGGIVTVAAPPGARPRLVNRLLRELPVDPTVAGAPAEFTYGAPAPAAAEIVPVAPGTDARAWAWRESVSLRCDESGATESECRFEIENEGRDAVSLTLAANRQVVAVLVDGGPPPGLEFGQAGGTWRIPLPRGRRGVEVVVRTLARDRTRAAAWRVDPEACSLDVPVLDREVRLLVPPALVVPGAAEESSTSASRSWSARLIGVGAAASEPDAGSAPGFRAVAVEPPWSGGVLVVRRSAISATAILAAVVAGGIAFLLAGRRPAAALALAAACGVATLWLPLAFVPVARAAWWAAGAGLASGLAGLVPRRFRTVAVTTIATWSAVAAWPPAVAAGGDVRVFVTSGTTGDTAFVPEPLFRALAGFIAPETAAIRTLACRVDAGGVATDGWRVAIEVDADAGGVLVLDAGPGARWQSEPGVPSGVTASCAGREARLTASAAGRHVVALGLVPDVVRQGDVEIATAGIPGTPVAEVRVGGGAVECERAVGGGAFAPAPSAGGAVGPVFDVSAADRVRLVRPVDPRDRLATTARTAETVNELEWTTTACRVTATIDLDAGPDLLRSIRVRPDPRLERLAASVAGAAAPRVVPLGAGRATVEFAAAARGRTRVMLEAVLPLADPVGVFDAPGIWIEGLPTESRTIRLAAADGLDAVLDSPPTPATAAESAGRPPARVVVRRRRVRARDIQNLSVSFAPTGVELALDARIDATAVALARIPIDVPVGCAVDRVALSVEDPADSEGRVPMEVAWTRVAADRLLVVVQRPRPGRYGLEVSARLARRPAPRGPLPLVMARLGSEAPLTVSCAAAPPWRVEVRAAGAAGRPDLVEVNEGEPVPDYELVSEVEPTPPEPAAPAVSAVTERNRVERAEMGVAFDGRGRVHGLARFDVVAPGPTVRLRLPPGMRLFDVLVDGRVIAAEPRAADAWDVAIGSTPWPRTLLAVFAGESPGAVGDGRPVSLGAPWIEGLPAPVVLWTLRPPAGRDVVVAPPARALDAAAATAARRAADDRVAAACAELAAGATGSERDRLEAIAALRRTGRGAVDEEAWRRARESDGRARGAVTVISTEPVVIRMIPAPDGTMSARALATMTLVAIAGLAWAAAGRAARPVS